MSVEGELRNVHTALTDLTAKVDEFKDATAVQLGSMGKEITELQITVKMLPVPPLRPCGDLSGHLKAHKAVSGRRWGVVASIVGGVALLVAAKLVNLI